MVGISSNSQGLDEYYGFVAPVYDSIRLDEGAELNETVNLFVERSAGVAGPFVEIGAGTGRHAAGVGRSGRLAVAVDLSIHQLSHAPTTLPRVQASAIALPFGTGTVTVCAFVMMVHQLTRSQLESSIQEAARIVRAGGILFVKTASESDIRTRPFASAFPTGTEINLKRYPNPDSITALASQAGFTPVDEVSQTFLQLGTSERFLNAIRRKHTSTLALIPKDEFDDGLRLVEDQLGAKDTEHALPISHTVLIMKRETDR